MSNQNKPQDGADNTNNMDKLVSRNLQEKRLELIEDETTPTSTPITGKADNIDRIVSGRLRKRRIMLGLSQKEVGKAVDVSIQQMQKYEKAMNRISSGKLFTVARFLKVPITYFYEQDNDNEPIRNEFAEDANLPSEQEILNIVKAFRKIKNSRSRKKLTELIQAIS